MVNQTVNGQTGSSRAIAIPSAREISTKYGADFKHTALSSWNGAHLLVNGEKKLTKMGVYAQKDFPEMLGLKMLKGNYANAISEPGSIIISQSACLRIWL